MTDNSPKFITGFIAFSIYFILVGLVVFYFNTKNRDIPKKYVKENDNRIQVTISMQKIKNIPKVKLNNKPKIEKQQQIISPPKIKPVKKLKSVVKKDIKKKIINEKRVKKIIKKKVIKKKVIKKKIKKELKKIIKKKELKKIIKKKEKIVKKEIKVKSKKTSDLFSTIKTKSKPIKNKKRIVKKVVKKSKPIKVIKPSASERISNSLKIQKRKDKGIENAYFSKVQSLLETWPAQSEYVGEMAMVRISVKPTGMFEFTVKTQSSNVDFNEQLIAFLKQLQHIGLGKHNAGRSYEFNVEFIAKE